MGWIGVQKEYKTNLECVKYQVLYGKEENDKQWYRGLVQRGSNVYILGQNKSDNKYWIDVVMCQTTSCHGYREFMYRGENAVAELFMDIPKKWINLLDKNDEEVQKYISFRTEYEAKRKAKYTPQLEDVFRCTYGNDISWNGYTIPKGEVFYIKYTKWYEHKYFFLCNSQGHIYHNRITRKLFNKLNAEKISV